MVNAQELRIGNYVKDDFGRIGYIIALGIKKSTVKLEFSRLTTSYDELEPIALTHDLLLKFGFEKDESQISEQHPWAQYVLDDVVISLPYFEYDFESTTIEIKSVHQLMNLYNALTTKELTLKQ